MPRKQIRVLYIDDYPLDRALVRDALLESDLNYQISEAANQEEFFELLSEDFDLVLSDFNILGFTGLEVLEAVQEVYPTLPVIIVTGTGTEEIAAEAIKRGAADYVIKSPQHIHRLPLTIQSVLEKAKLKEEQRIAQQELVESEARYSQLVETLQEGIWTIDEEGVTTFVNPALAEMLGYKMEEMLGRHLYDFMDQQAKELAQQNLERRQQGEEAQHDFIFLHHDGRQVHTNLISSPILDEEGNYQGAVAAVRDISIQIEAENALQDSRLELQTLVDNTPGSIWTLDRNYRLVSANSKFLEDLEKAFQKPVHRGYELLANISREEKREWQELYDRALNGEKIRFERQRRYGEPGRWYEYIFSPIKDERGLIKEVMVQAMDITDRKESEIRLAENEAKYHLLVDQIGAALILHDLDGNLIEVNQVALDLYGYSRDELLSMNVVDLDIDIKKREGKDVFDKNFVSDPFQVITSHRTKSGENIPVEITISPLEYQGQKYLLTMATDITDRLRTQQILAENELKYRTLTEESPAAIYETDTEGSCVYVNAKWRKISGLTAEEAAGKGWIQGLHPADQEQIRAAWEHFVRSGTSWNLEYRFQDKEGHITWVQGEAVPLKDDEGQIQGYLGTNTIINNRKEIEKQLLESNRTLDALLGNLPGMGFRCRNNPDWEMLFVSGGAKELFGYSPQELTDGKSISFGDLIHPDDRMTVWDQIQEAFAEDNPYRIQYRIIDRDGDERWVQEQGLATKLDREGNVIELDGFIQDITDQVKAAQDLESTTETMTTILDSIDAHIYVSDLESFEILYMNDKMIQDFEGEYLGQKCYRVFRGKSSPCAYCTVPDLVDGEGNPTGPQVWEGRNEKTGRWYLNTHRAVPWTDRRLAHIQIAVDIHDRKVAEQSLQESEERFRSSFENTTVGMALIDREGNFLSLNQSACSILNYPVDELLEKTYLDVTHPDHRKVSEERFLASLEERQPYSLEKKYLTREGQTIICLTSKSPVFSEKDEFLYSVAHLINITQEKQIEKEIRAQQEFYNQILSSVRDGIWVTNQNDRMIYFNPAMEVIAGVKAEDMLGLSVFDDFPAETTEHFLAHYREARESGNPTRYEASVVTPAGRETVQAGWLIPRLEENRYRGMICTIQDVTEQRKNIRELERSEIKFRSLFENMLDGFALHEIVLDQKGVPVDYIYLEVNSAFEEMTGLPTDQVVGKRVTEVIPGIKDDPADWIGQYGRVVLEREEFRFEQYSEPLERWYSVLAYSPAPNQFATIFEDITSQKQANQALRDSEARYRTLFETALEALVIHEDGQILEVNQTFLDMYRTTYKEVLGENPVKFTAPESLPEVRKRVEQPYDHIQEYIAKRGDGTTFPILLDAKSITYKGKRARLVSIRDITEQKETKQALEESEQRYRELFDGMANLAVIYDREAHFRVINQAAAQNLGSKVEECLGQKLGVFIPENQAMTIYRIEQVLDSDQTQRYEDRLELPDGSVGWYDTVMQPVNLPGEPEPLVLSISTDITERKEFEQQLHESEQRYRQLYQSSGVGVGYYTPEGKVITYNEIALNQIDVELDEVVGKSISELFPAEQAALYLDRFQRVLEEDTRLEFEDQVELPGGKSWFFSIYSMIKDQQEQPVGVQIISLDITERKQLEETLRRSDIIVSSTSDSVIATDSQGLITFWNPGAEEIYGYSAEEVLGQPTSILYRDEDIPQLERNIAEMNSGATLGTIEVTNLTKDGQEVYMLLTLSTILDSEGEVIELVGISKDITPLRIAEQSLRLEKQRTQQYLDVAEIMLVAIDTHQRVQTINPKGCELLGYPEDEILGKNWFDNFLDEAEIERVKEVHEQVISGDVAPVEYFENHIVRADGSRRLIAWHNSVLENEAGKIIGVFSSGEDITDRRAAEIELLKSKETAERYLNIAAEIIISLSREGTITLLNPSGHRLLGYQPGELIEKNWFTTCLPEDSIQDVRKVFAGLMQGEQTSYEVVESKVVTHSGDIKDILWHNSLLRDDEGNITGLLSSGEDITQRNEILEELTRSRQLLFSLSQAAREIQNLMDVDEIYKTIGEDIADLGFNTFIFSLAHDGTELRQEYLSYDFGLLEKATELTGLIASDFKIELKEGSIFRQILENQNTYLGQISHEIIHEALPPLTKPLAGTLIKIFGLETAIFAPMIAENQTLGLIVVLGEDLMEEDVPPIALFASQASTALRNARYAEALQQRTEELINLTTLISDTEESERKRLSQELHDQVGQSLALLGFNLNQLKDQLDKHPQLDKSKIENAQEILNEVTSGIRSVMDDLRPAILDDYGLQPALHWYADKIGQHSDLEISVKGKALEPRVEKRREVALFRITQEALTNITRHAQASRVDIELSENKDLISLSIKDNGVGFDPHKRKKHEPGTGWGLINMKERALRMGGTLNIDTEKDKGTTLTIQLPRES